ncbi:hypothetical protein [Streptomyces sp. NBC_00878]|uniref:hypothetical protein n=1 Tax=Streptomyces sp. NBC_00878 TaxID=2975854 RepID=UPI0022580E7D|nr:hypothetical protein [Streptomyces sp. NBC_00878]MCX4905056.1 hypothetical protein [Streptomyces sp. NBC_00878]
MRRPRRRGRGLLAGTMTWSLVVVPILVFLASRSYGTPWVAVFVCLACLSGAMSLAIGDSWVYAYSAGRAPRDPSTAPWLTAAALLFTAPGLAPWAFHELAGQPTQVRVIEVEPAVDSQGEDTGLTHYRIADAATERDLGRMWFGPRTRVPVGAVISVSVIPDGWSPPVATERLKDADAFVTTFAVLVTVHVLACAVTAAAWPRKPQS